MPALFILNPVFFNTAMQAEWLSDMEPGAASVLMSAPTMGLFVGWAAGAVIWTSLADKYVHSLSLSPRRATPHSPQPTPHRYGRRRVFLCCAWSTVVMAALNTAAWDFPSFVILRGLLGLIGSGQAALIHFQHIG